MRGIHIHYGRGLKILPMRDEELIKEIAKGNEKALKELMNLYRSRLFFYAYGILQNYEDAEEAVSETFYQVWRSAKSFRGGAKVSTWLFGITRNVSRNMLRKRLREPKTLEIMEQDALLDDTHLEGEDIQLIKEALEKLPPTHREVLHLAFYEDFSYEEIANILGVPLGTVKTRVFHAKRKLLEVINEELKKSL